MFVTPKVSSGRPSLAGQSFLNASITGRRSTQTTPRSTPTFKRSVGQVLHETVDHVVTALNTPVPVQVQEALKTSGGDVDVCLAECGWAWLVVESKLLLWRYSSQQVTTQCISMNLPPTRPGSGWSSKSITVSAQANELAVPLLAVSPEGKVCYWSNVLRDTCVLCEEVLSLGDAHSFSLTPLPHSNDYLLSSSMTALFLIQPTEAQVLAREIPLPEGVLSGISRRFSSLLFGGGVTTPQETRGVVCGEGGVVLVLTDTHLQRWQYHSNKLELVYNVELKSIISDSVCLNQWVEFDLASNQITVWLVDVQLAGDNVIVLFAMVIKESTNAEYGLALFPLHSRDEPSPDVDNLLRLDYTTSYTGGSSYTELLRFTLLGSPHTLAMYDRHTVLLVKLSKGVPDMVSFPTPNCVLGAGPAPSHAPSHSVLFTLHQGVVCLASNTSSGTVSQHRQLTTPLRQSFLATPTPLTRTASALVAPEVSEEATEILKTAFAEYLEGNLARVEEMCEDHFPPALFSLALDTPGDVGVVGLSTLIMDDKPVNSDPGWSEGADPPGGKSLILIYRLEQKLQAHNRYMGFLADSGLLDRLTAITVRGRGLDTRLLLCEHAEKIQAAIAVRKTHNQITDELVRVAVRGRGPSPSSKTEQFYTQLSLCDSLLTALPSLHKDLLARFTSPQERVDLLLTTSSLLLTVLRDAILYRHNNIHMYQVPDTPRDHTHTMPPHEAVYWTSSDDMRSVLKQQVDLLMSVGETEAGEQDKIRVWSLVGGLADILFDGYKVHIDALPLDSTRWTEVQRSFEADRTRILTSLVEVGQHGHATELAEKYGDFRVLVQLCDGAGDSERIRDYMHTYKAQGFSEFLFKWYLDEGKLQELLSFSESLPAELSSFLTPHPHLRWLHSISVKDYHQAHGDLKTLADREAECVAKKKTLLSLSKLSLLAAKGGRADTSQLDSALYCIEYQQNLPQETLEVAGLDAELMPPLSTQQIIELYVGGDHHQRGGDEGRFIAALELIHQTYPEESAEGTELRCYIWSQAILRDDWSQLDMDDPLKELQKTFFSGLIVEGYGRGLDVLSLLPELPRLLSYEALTERGVASDPVFQFMLRAGYEQLHRVQANMRAGLDTNTGQTMDSD